MQEDKAAIKFIEKCYKLYEQKLYQIAYKILHDEGKAEDAVQEAFMKLMKRNIYFEDVESDECKRYIITVIKNAAINIYNKSKREQEIIYFSDYSDFDKIEDKKELDDCSEEVRALINKLPKKYYDIVDCMVIKEMSVKETAIFLDISETNVRKRFERVKRMLKTVFEGDDKNEAGKGFYKFGNI